MKENKKQFLLILTAFICASSLSAQPYGLKKTWVGTDLEYLKIDSQKVYFELFGSYPEQLNYLIKKDTLRLFYEYTTSRDKSSKVHVKAYNFQIMKNTNQLLHLRPIDSNALILCDNKKLLKYKERSLLQDTNFQFKELKFKATSCYGRCPEISLQITDKKELKFIGGEHAIKKGFFTARIPDSLYSELLEILYLSDLKNLKTWPQIVQDAPEYTLEIAYDDQIKCLKTFFLPSVCHELIHYLLTTPRKVILEKADYPFNILFESTCGYYPNPIYIEQHSANH